MATRIVLHVSLPGAEEEEEDEEILVPVKWSANASLCLYAWPSRFPYLPTRSGRSY